MTGLEVIEYHRQARKDAADKLKAIRSVLRKSGLLLKSSASTWSFAGIHPQYVPFKPTRRNFWVAMKDRAYYASGPSRNYGNEYYSCCGLEDAEGERKNYAREQAVGYFRAWCHLVG